LFWVPVNYLLVTADRLHTFFARIQSAAQRLIVMPAWNNRHVDSPNSGISNSAGLFRKTPA